MSYLAIVYACALAVFGAALVWLLPMAVIAVSESVATRIRARRKQAEGEKAPAPRFRPMVPRVPGIQRLSHMH